MSTPCAPPATIWMVPPRIYGEAVLSGYTEETMIIEDPEETPETPEDPIESPEDPIESPEEPLPEDPPESPEDPPESPEDPSEPESPEESGAPEEPEEEITIPSVPKLGFDTTIDIDKEIPVLELILLRLSSDYFKQCAIGNRKYIVKYKEALKALHIYLNILHYYNEAPNKDLLPIDEKDIKKILNMFKRVYYSVNHRPYEY